MSQLYVVTDADGVQHLEGYERRWPLPVPDGADWQPGGLVEPDEHGAPVLIDAAGLLERLGTRIFAAEPVGDAGAARLVAGTAWSDRLAASFALDCVEHALPSIPGTGDAELPSGDTLAEVIAAARAYLDGEPRDAKRLGYLARRAARRRLRRDADQLSDAAFEETARAEGEDREVLDDPIWETVAAAHEAVLAAVEAVRHLAMPSLSDHEARVFERRKAAGVEVTEVDTPWGLFPVGGGGPRYAPGWAAARDSAERAREAVGDEIGPEAEAAERAWQVGHLVELLAAG